MLNKIYRMKKQLLLFIISVAATFSCYAQDSLMNLAQAEAASGKLVTINTFKDTRLINQKTLECLGPRTLNLEISHRFGELNSGSYYLSGN